VGLFHARASAQTRHLRVHSLLAAYSLGAHANLKPSTEATFVVVILPCREPQCSCFAKHEQQKLRVAMPGMLRSWTVCLPGVSQAHLGSGLNAQRLERRDARGNTTLMRMVPSVTMSKVCNVTAEPSPNVQHETSLLQCGFGRESAICGESRMHKSPRNLGTDAEFCACRCCCANILGTSHSCRLHSQVAHEAAMMVANRVAIEDPQRVTCTACPDIV
jgi:hypothetical protein